MQVWSTNQVEGVHRFLARSFRLVTGDNVTEDEPSKDQLRSLHIAIKRVRPRPWKTKTSPALLCNWHHNAFSSRDSSPQCHQLWP